MKVSSDVDHRITDIDPPVKSNRRFDIFAIRELPVGLLLFGLLTGPSSAETPPLGTLDETRPIRVPRSHRLPATLSAERISIGPGYKPAMARLPGGELVMMFFTSEKDTRDTMSSVSSADRPTTVRRGRFQGGSS
jgi:hypothetical protein